MKLSIEKLRRGADAEKLKKNLRFLGEKRKEGKIKSLFVNCVLQAANVAEIYEMLEYYKKIGVDKVQFSRLLINRAHLNDKIQEQMSIYDNDGYLKEKYRCYFTEKVLLHPLADWANNAKYLGVQKKMKRDEYDLF